MVPPNNIAEWASYPKAPPTARRRTNVLILT